MGGPSELDDYLFDLRGYLVLRGAVCPEHVGELNAALAPYESLGVGQWRGHVHRYKLHEIHQVYEIGAPFEALIDHPAYLGHLRRYIDSDDGLFIDEAFVNLRGQGGATGMHCGGHTGRVRTQYRYYNGRFRCAQINVALALSDIGPGDGATMLIPGSHKASLPHPDREGRPGSLEAVEGAVEVFLAAGDVVLFVDATTHGSARRENPGERRLLFYRYGPHFGHSRYGYRPSPELLSRLTDARRAIVRPIAPLLPPDPGADARCPS
jgi:hypothetical protein